ncbi:1-(5-phosphoribosyl)-5-[(5-phosphoribosylamino)methylideneamino]imidazole-4-carboxamide isomerase [Anaerotruncus colihominis]|uniref:1-(5-phosphoribosyl)-5-[(5-phosphoribosylamino)methylideneamino] imidazole-4-carboxamide isomerase n=1 Tax=Anaerotruncus colihominis TaxID=169435 RepID=A0A845RDW6_9FIRM|nr:1-(5-phosphoribosyl)-5-[(5-phosphoribosylamino)methylideneamino]imidazole-4-carboxamide isomerase [Anaerotruncus colihominis]NBI77769.1 1-(5-phosphoribosyl)-5-[(5-phosphoribosylamino)methylideneamino]imidazole-4-carboxamide isomerase [Anaerotruncus colihominis]
MIILPAIDIKDGCCVRLRRGDFATAHKVAEDAVQTAETFRNAGAAWVHMVDLDGAKEGSAKNEQIFFEIARNSGLRVELGGGIRDMAAVERYLEHGIARVILGSAAVKNPTLVKDAVRAYGSRIAVGIDARDGMVATEGWLDTSEIHYIELARRMGDIGVKYIIFTDIARDGMQEGVNLDQLSALHEAVSCNVIASGGVRDLHDIESCAALGLYGVICGKSIYTGSLDLRRAIERAGEQTC